MGKPYEEKVIDMLAKQWNGFTKEETEELKEMK